MASQQSSRWVVKPRNYELDTVKYEVKLKPIMRDQDPLNVDISEIQTKAKKKIIKKADLPSKKGTSSSTKMFANISRTSKDPLANVSRPSQPQQPNKGSTDPMKNDAGIALPHNAKKVEDVRHLQYSLIVNKDFNVDDKIEVNWLSLKKNLTDLFCNNFNMEVKSLYSFDFSDDVKKTYQIEKGRTRIEELESNKNDFDVVTSGEFVKKMEVIKREMMQKWEKEDKVGTLKIIIQCTKMLNDVFTPKFYTHKFLLIADILDNFARLVYERILKLSFGSKNLVDFSNINPTIGTQVAKDVCSNWIFKCCCIRELLPRIYIDISFLGIFKFIMSDSDLEKKIITIAKMIRGISHPLIAFYVSMYLCKITLQLFPKSKQFMYILLTNLAKFNLDDGLIKRLNYENITIDELKKVLDPCVEWVVYCTCKDMTGKDFKNLMKVYDLTKSYFILKGIIIHSPAKYIFSEQYLEYLFACFEMYKPEETVFLCMLVCQKILITDFPIDSQYIAIMWEKIKNTKNKGLFIDCCGLLGEILIKFHNEDVQDKFFEEVFDIFKTTFSSASTMGEEYSEVQNYFAKFEVFLYGILTKITNYSGILSGDNFLFLLENFTPEIKLNICNTIINQIIQQKEKIKDPYLAFSLLKIGRYIHDSIEVFSPAQKKKEVADILINFIYKIDFGIDYETYLNFLTEARSYYTDLEEVIEVLIKEVQKIAIQTYKIVKGKHNKKTMRFCKVCVAYCQITIPGIISLQTQLKLLLTTAQIALMNKLISECDSIVRNIISGIQKEVVEYLDKLEADFIINYSKSLMGFLVLVPSNPDGPYQLINEFINIFNSETLQKTLLVTKTKVTIFVSLVKFLTTQMQTKLPYHVYNVESNDEIFTGDEQFKKEGQEIIENIINDILTEISDYDSKLTPYDYDEFEFMIMICGDCIEVFKYNFEETKFETNVQNKMYQLIEKYITCLERNTGFGIQQKIQKYKGYYNLLSTN